MMKRTILLAAAAVAAASVFGDIRFKNIYQNNMVLQANEENVIAGKTDEPNKPVALKYRAVSKDGKVAEKTISNIKSDKLGRWFAKLPAFPKRTVLDIEASSEGQSARIQNIVTGELWMGSGQSNMEWNFGANTVDKEYVKKYQLDADASNGDIRIFTVQHNILAEPIDEVCGDWRKIDARNVRGASQVCYIFASKLSKALDTPVGVINSSWSGTRVEPWISKEAYMSSPACKAIYEEQMDGVENYNQIRGNYIKNFPKWIEKNPTNQLQNKNNKDRPKLPKDIVANNQLPANLYNGMIHGIAPLAPKGVLWYQGESNAGQPYQYGELIKLMVSSWRKHFKRDFHFFYVELAAINDPQKDPVHFGSWGGIREAQAEVLELPNTGVASSADNGGSKLGGRGDIHPPHKEFICGRLANLALAQVYKKGALSRAVSPSYKSMKIEGDKIVIELDNAEGLALCAHPAINSPESETPPPAEKITGFAIRGENPRDWKWADAEIKNGKLIVSSPEVSEPKAVRYGWCNWPLISLKNKYGLPLRPFSTDGGAYLDYNRKKN